ncbi:unnamed protein product, partial [Didymodactylos carnosus]
LLLSFFNYNTTNNSNNRNNNNNFIISMASFLSTTKGKRLLRFNGYEYVTEKKSGEKTYWKCKDYWSKKYNFRIHTLNIDDSIVQQPKFDHDHPVDAAKSEVRDLMNNLKDRAKTTNETTNDILSTFMTAPEPLDLYFDRIPYNLIITKRNDNFLCFHSGPGADRIIIFSSPAQQKIMGLAILPICFVLLPNKTQITYQQMINQISIICPLWLPQTVMMDFEKEPINVLGDAFPNIQMTGCFFHFRQTIHRKIQELGMQNDYNTNARFARQARMTACLALIPVDDVVDAFGELSDELPLAFKPLLLYFQQHILAVHVLMVELHGYLRHIGADLLQDEREEYASL